MNEGAFKGNKYIVGVSGGNGSLSASWDQYQDFGTGASPALKIATRRHASSGGRPRSGRPPCHVTRGEG